MCKPSSGRPLSPLLRRRFKPGRSADERRAVFDALVEHYRLTEMSKAMRHRTEALSPEDEARSLFWEALAQSLMFDFIPAFQLKQSKADKHILIDWMKAGGTVPTFYADSARYYRHFYQAQLVWRIQEQKRQKKRSRAWVFRWFANKEETQGRREHEKRTLLLPRPYRKRSTEKSLKHAFGSIPPFVRNRPHEYLPPTGLGAAQAQFT
jgi:hypothetical protein